MTATLKSGSGGGINLTLAWRIFLGSMIAAALLIGLLAFFTYRWAGTLVDDSEAPKVDHNALSVEKLVELNTIYEKKKRIFSEILNTRPEAPGINGGRGVDLTGEPPIIPQDSDVGTDRGSSLEPQILP